MQRMNEENQRGDAEMQIENHVTSQAEHLLQSLIHIIQREHNMIINTHTHFCENILLLTKVAICAKGVWNERTFW